MPRYPNPYATTERYPTDPSYGVIGSSLARALFGDPEMAAQAQLRQAQQEQARAAAREHGARATQYEDETGARRRWGDIFDPREAALLQGNPNAATPEQHNKWLGGQITNGLANVFLDRSGLAHAVPQAATVAPAPVAAALAEEPPMDGSEITVAARRAPPLPTPPPYSVHDAETSARLASALMGHGNPSNQTAYISDYGTETNNDKLQSEERRNKYTADTNYKGDVYKANSSAGATIRAAGIHAGAARYNSDLEHQDRRYIAGMKFDPMNGGGLSGAMSKPLPVSAGANIDSEIGTQAPGLTGDLLTKVRIRANQIAQTNGRNLPAATQQALSELVSPVDTRSTFFGIPVGGSDREYREKPRAPAPASTNGIIRYDSQGNRIK